MTSATCSVTCMVDAATATSPGWHVAQGAQHLRAGGAARGAEDLGGGPRTSQRVCSAPWLHAPPQDA
eukprot:8008284-Pyramimonas_sp.AAC.1